MRQIRRGLLLLLLLLSVVLVACGSSEEAVAVKHIVVEAKEFSFSPADLTVKVGEEVKIEFKNYGVVEHDFSIEKLPVSGEVTSHGDEHTLATTHDDHNDHADAVHVVAKAGNMGHLSFTPSQAGEYQIICTVAGHKEAGMVGKLVVTP